MGYIAVSRQTTMGGYFRAAPLEGYRNMPDVVPVKTEFGVPQALWSCHTARIGDYTIEGHVPAEDILRMLDTRPQIAGIAVPGMPAGSPGMEVPGYSEPYDVYAFSGDNLSVFASHEG